jgi:hypothetical protein
VASSAITLSTKPSSSIFNCISSQNSCLFTLSAGVKVCTNRILCGLKHSSLCNTFHAVILGMPNSLLVLATDLRGLRWNASRTLPMLTSDTSIQFPQTVGTTWLHYPCMVRLVLSRARTSRCTVITDLDHLKTEHTESLLLLRRHLGNWPRGPAVSMGSELV